MFNRRRNDPDIRLAKSGSSAGEVDNDISPAEPSIGRDEFNLVEYREASIAYFKGVDIGFATLRNFILLNAALLAIIGASADPQSEYFDAFSKANTAIPFIGLVATFLFAASLRYYNLHLENCRSRCAEIESLYGGKLFSRLGDVVSRGRTSFRVISSLRFLLFVFMLFWIYLILRSTVDFGALAAGMVQFARSSVENMLSR